MTLNHLYSCISFILGCGSLASLVGCGAGVRAVAPRHDLGLPHRAAESGERTNRVAGNVCMCVVYTCWERRIGEGNGFKVFSDEELQPLQTSITTTTATEI